MVQRLRPGRAPANLQFSRTDLLRTMAEMDVAPYFRERLEAVSHPVPNLTLCMQMYQFDVIDDDELVQKLMDLGYDSGDANDMMQAQKVKVARLNASAGHGWTPAAMAQAYAVGRLTDEQVDEEMSALGFSQSDSDRLKRRGEIELSTAPIRRIQQQTIRSALATQERAYRCGAISADALASAYTSAGIPANVAGIAAANVDSAVAVDLCRAQITSFKRALLTGRLSLAQTEALLTQVGIPELRKQQLLKSWVVEAQTKAPQATAATILRWVAKGLLDRETASARLANLGWSDPDLTLMLAESLAKSAAAQQRILAQAARSQQQAARAALRAAQQAESSARQLRSRLKGIASRSQLQKWYKEGLVDDTYFVDAMKARGYDDDSTLKYLEEAQLMRAKATKPPQPKAGKGAPTNGTA